MSSPAVFTFEMSLSPFLRLKPNRSDRFFSSNSVPLTVTKLVVPLAFATAMVTNLYVALISFSRVE